MKIAFNSFSVSRTFLIAALSACLAPLACSSAPEAPFKESTATTVESPLLSNWRTMPGTATGGVGVASWGVNRLDAFFVTTHGTLGHVWSDDAGTNWAGVEDLGGWLPIGSTPAAVSWGPGRIDVFVKNTANVIDHVWYEQTIPGGFKWDVVSNYTAGWGAHPDAHLGSPAVSSWGPNRLDIFYVAPDRTVRHKWHDVGGWGYGEEPLGGQVVSAPAATSWGPGRIDIAAVGLTYGISHRAYDGGWRDWDGAQPGYEGIYYYDGPIKRGVQPAITSTSANELDLFFMQNGDVAQERWHWSWSPVEWQRVGPSVHELAVVYDHNFGDLQVVTTSAAGVMSHARYRTSSYCGDGNCNPEETYSTCPRDCSPPPPRCGDGACNGSENSYTCPSDCGSPKPVTTLFQVSASGPIESGFIPYGASFGSSGTLLAVSIPPQVYAGPLWSVKFVKYGRALDCADPADGDYVQGFSGATLTSAQMTEIFGSPTPPLPVWIPSCSVPMPIDPFDLSPKLPLMITYR
jgi:hypothetical protein